MGGYSIREMTEDEFKPLFLACSTQVFEDTHSYELASILSPEERLRTKELSDHMGAFYKLYLGVFDEDENFVGWSWGIQENATTFYMVNSAILAEHRRRGLYGMLVERCIHLLSGKGFQLIYSRHCATNNAVIIPKLKAGFIISKMEIDDRFGVLIHLHFYPNATRRKIMDYRAGQTKPDDALKITFKL